MSGLKLFDVDGGVREITTRAVDLERELQDLVEADMELFLGARFLATEYSTGPQHGGRIDSLGLDENGAPVIVEYKRGRDAGVINQGLYYLSWLVDHKAEFQHLVRDRLGATAADRVNWSAPRLVCIAEDFTRYDAHAIREMSRSIDLVRYRCFGRSLFALEPFASATAPGARPRTLSRVRGGGRPAVPADGAVAGLKDAVGEFLAGLGDDVTQVERKQYRAYRRLRNFACVTHSHKNQVLVYLHTDPRGIDLVPGFTRDVTGIGHHGTGNLEIRLRTEKDVRRAEGLFRLSYAVA